MTTGGPRGEGEEIVILKRDPFDRMLVAQALDEGLTLVSKDQAMRAYDVPLLGW